MVKKASVPLVKALTAAEYPQQQETFNKYIENFAISEYTLAAGTHVYTYEFSGKFLKINLIHVSWYNVVQGALVFTDNGANFTVYLPITYPDKQLDKTYLPNGTIIFKDRLIITTPAMGANGLEFFLVNVSGSLVLSL